MKDYNYQFKSPVASTGNLLPFVFVSVAQVINNTTSHDTIPLTTVLHCNIYFALKWQNPVFLCKKHVININANITSLFAQLTVASIQWIFGVQVAHDSQQHEAYTEIYVTYACYDL